MDRINNFNCKDVGHVLRALRLIEGYTLKELSTMTKISISKISSMENGEIANPDDVMEFLDFYRLSLDDFVGLVESNSEDKDLRSEIKSLPAFKNNISNEEFGEIIKSIRKYSGLTRQEAADLIGISQGYLYEIENANRVPSSRVLRNIVFSLWSLELQLNLEHGVDNTNISGLLDNYLLENNISYREIARKAKLPLKLIGSIWRKGFIFEGPDKNIPSIVEFIQIAHALDMTASELIELTNLENDTLKYIKK